MKILALVEDLRINVTSAGICNSNILSCLLKNQHEVTCIYDYSESNIFSWLDFPNVTFSKIDTIDLQYPYKIISNLPKGDAFLAYTTGFGSSQLKKIHSWDVSVKKHLKKNNYDLILVLGAGNSMLNYFAMPRINTKIPYVVNYHDPYPDHQYPVPYNKKKSWVNILRAKRSDEVMRKAKLVSFPSRRLQEWMLQFHPILKDKSIILPHPNGELKNLPELNQDSQVFLDTTKFNIIHAGSLLGHRDPTVLIKAYNRFLQSDIEKKEKSVLSIIGSIDKKNKILSMNLMDFQENISIISNRISYKKSKALFKTANVLLLLEATAKDSPFMPGKLSDYITEEKPIMALSPKYSEVSRLLGANYPYLSESDNEEKIHSILNLLWGHWKLGEHNKVYHEDLNKYISADNYNNQLIRNFKK